MLDATVSGHSRAAANMEPTAVVITCTRSIQAQARPNLSMEREAGHKLSSLAKEEMVTLSGNGTPCYVDHNPVE